jgi:hypothetical protein
MQPPLTFVLALVLFTSNLHHPSHTLLTHCTTFDIDAEDTPSPPPWPEPCVMFGGAGFATLAVASAYPSLHIVAIDKKYYH